MSRSVVPCLCLTLLAAVAPPASAQQSATDRVATIKQWLAESKARMKDYTWTQTTVVSVKGEVQSTKVSRCYYDATGTLQREPVSASAPSGNDLASTDTAEKAIALVRTYVPPNPLKLQARKDAGRVSLDAASDGKSIRVKFHDYELPGDTLSVTIDPSTNRVLGLEVATLLDKPRVAVALSMTVGTLPDGTEYPNVAILNAAAKELTVTVTNSDYRRAGR